MYVGYRARRGSHAPFTGILSQMFTKAYIAANPHLFVDTAWIDVAALRSFLADRDSECDTIVISSSSPRPSEPPTRVKREFHASDASLIDLTVKSEAMSIPLPIRMRSSTEGDHEVIELLSDSEDDGEETPSGELVFFQIIFSTQRSAFQGPEIPNNAPSSPLPSSSPPSSSPEPGQSVLSISRTILPADIVLPSGACSVS